MRAIYTMILASIASLGAEPFSIPSAGVLKIGEASITFIGDGGGSISIILFDEGGNQWRVYCKPNDTKEGQVEDWLTFHSTKHDNKISSTRFSSDEDRLLNYIRAACVVSFGSSDPLTLREFYDDPRNNDGLQRLALASLLAMFQDESKKQNKPHMATPSKPSD